MILRSCLEIFLSSLDKLLEIAKIRTLNYNVQNFSRTSIKINNFFSLKIYI